MRYECQTCTKLNLLSQRIFSNATCLAFLWFLFRLEIANYSVVLARDVLDTVVCTLIAGMAGTDPENVEGEWLDTEK